MERRAIPLLLAQSSADRTSFEYWKYTHLTIDVVPGRGAGFSVEGPTGNRFIIRSRMLDDAELTAFGLKPGA